MLLQVMFQKTLETTKKKTCLPRIVNQIFQLKKLKFNQNILSNIT